MKLWKTIKTKIKRIRVNSELKKSNWGRAFGWFVEFNGRKIGELTDLEWVDMFWFDYRITVYKGFEEEILNEQNWMHNNFEFQNKHYLQYANNAFSNGKLQRNNNGYIISMRGLHLTSLEE